MTSSQRGAAGVSVVPSGSGVFTPPVNEGRPNMPDLLVAKQLPGSPLSHENSTASDAGEILELERWLGFLVLAGLMIGFGLIRILVVRIAALRIVPARCRSLGFGVCCRHRSFLLARFARAAWPLDGPCVTSLVQRKNEWGQPMFHFSVEHGRKLA